MIEISALSDLSLYANFEVYYYEDKEIIIYDDHRCVLTALFEAKKLGVINDETNLISFDLHDDARPIHPDTNKILMELKGKDLSEISSRDFKSFVEFDVSEYDDDWVKIGMELGLINNILNIGCEENDNIREWNHNRYVTKKNQEHKGFVLRHLKDELNSHGGRIADSALRESDRIREILSLEHIGVCPSLSENANFVLDFDLDCFTTTCMEKRFAWPERIFRDVYVIDCVAAYLMNELINKSKFITICREPSYCGGIGESNKILNYLDRFFFKGCLSTEAMM